MNSEKGGKILEMRRLGTENGTLGCPCSSAGCVLGKPVKLAVCLQMEVDGLQWEHLPSTLVQNKSHSVQTAVVYHLSSSVFMLNIN